MSHPYIEVYLVGRRRIAEKLTVSVSEIIGMLTEVDQKRQTQGIQGHILRMLLLSFVK